MLKNICKLEVQVNDKLYQLLCDNDAPSAHIKESLCQFLKYVGQVEDQVNAQIEAQKELDKVVHVEEEPKTEDTQEKTDDQPAV